MLNEKMTAAFPCSGLENGLFVAIVVVFFFKLAVTTVLSGVWQLLLLSDPGDRQPVVCLSFLAVSRISEDMSFIWHGN